MTLTHAQIWTAIDRLAARAKLSTSGLAKRAGLDPTTFNKSKRITPDGRERWPSTESIAKSLTATGATLEQFVALVADVARGGGGAMPVISLDDAAARGRFDDSGAPAGEGWSTMAFPAVNDPHAYALEIRDNALDPAYGEGTRLVVSPAAPVRRGNRVIVRTRGGEVMVCELKRRTARTLEVRPLNAGAGDRLLLSEEVMWIARIVWASQ